MDEMPENYSNTPSAPETSPAPSTAPGSVKEPPPLIRIGILTFFIMAFYTLIAMRLWDLQIQTTGVYNVRAARQYVRQIRIPAVRGSILSRDGQVLAGNRVSYEMVFHLEEMRKGGKRKNTVDFILKEARRAGRIIGRESPLTEESIIRRMNYFPGIPMTVFEDLTRRELACLAEALPPVQGMELLPEPRRIYPGGESACHLIGYTGVVNPANAEDRREFFYYLPDPMGRTGIEKLCNETLRGTPGKKKVIVDSRGFVHEELGVVEQAVHGSDVVLTIDTRAQKIAESLLAGKEGAMVVLDASYGEVLAMASAPGYDLNKCSPRILADFYRELLRDPRRPLMNKAIFGSYMPGSIIKVLVGLSMQENGAVPGEEFRCDGRTRIGETLIKCTGIHHRMDLISSLERSCNDYFIEGGLRTGVRNLAKVFASAGLGEKTNIGLPEVAGRLPLPEKYRSWNRYDTALISIGQGRIELTPLQAALYTAAIANGGIVYSPILIKEVKQDGKSLFRARKKIRSRLAASAGAIGEIRKGMYYAVHSPHGTGRRADTSKLILHGKTGTAEVGPLRNRYKNTWFIGFGTSEETGKTYAIAVLVVRGEGGGLTSAPLAGAFFNAYLSGTPAGKR